VCDLETSRMGAPYIYDISHLRVNKSVVQSGTKSWVYFSISTVWDKEMLHAFDSKIYAYVAVTIKQYGAIM